MPLNQGLGPLPPSRGIQPVRGLESGAPSRLRPVSQPLFPVAPMGQMAPQQDPDELALDQLRSQPSMPQDVQSAPFEKPIFDAPKSFGGWLQNLQDDVSTFIEGIPAMLKQAISSGQYIAKNADWIDELYKNPKLLTKELSELKTAVIKGMTDTYKDGVGEALYKHPFTVLLDVTSIFDIVGGGLKMGGKAALTAAEKQAIKAGGKLPPSVATKLMALGDNVQRIPGKVFAAPFKGAGNLLMKHPKIESFAKGLALDPDGMARAKQHSTFMLNRRAEAAGIFEPLARQRIPKKNWAEYEELRMGYKPLEDASEPWLAKEAELWKEANAFYENFQIESGFKTSQELEAAALKPLAQRLWEDGVYQGELGKQTKSGFQYSQDALNAAKAWAEGANPTGKKTKVAYSPYIRDKAYDLAEHLDEMKSNHNSLQKVGRFEKKGLKGEGLVENPRQAEAFATLKMGELRGNLDYIYDTLQTRGVFVKDGKPPKNYVLMDPVLVKYVEDGLIPAYEIMENRKATLLAQGASEYDAVRGAAKAVEAEIGESALASAKAAADDPRSWQIAIPKSDAYIIQRSLGGVTGPLAFYDKVMNTWRSMVLRLMPRYYVNNLLGNAVLLTAGGHIPGGAAMNKKVMPAEALNSSGLMSEAGTRSDFLRGRPGMDAVYSITDKLADATDGKPRGLLSMTKAKEILQADAASGDTLAMGLLAKGSLDDAANEIAAARKRSLDLPHEQMVQAKKVSLLRQEQTKIESIDTRMQGIQQQIDMEKRLSNATPRPKQAISSKPRKAQKHSSSILSKAAAIREKYVNTPVGKYVDDLLEKSEAASRIGDGGLRHGVQKVSGVRDPFLTDEISYKFFSDKSPDRVHAGLFSQMRDEILSLAEEAAVERSRKALNVGPSILDITSDDISSFLGNSGRIEEKISRNAPASDIHAMYGRATDDASVSSRIEELNAQLKKAADEREAIAGAYPYTRSAGGIGEETEKLLALSREKEALAPLAQKMERAVVEMERFLGAYGRAHPLEREWIRRVIPFWQFVKTMNVLVATMPFVMPKRAFLWNQYAKLMLDGANDDRLPYRYRNHLPIGGTKDGQLILMRHSGWNPFDAVKAAEFGGMTIPKLVDPANNPFVKMVIESRGGYDTFTEKPFTEITDFTSLDGTVWSLDPKTGILEPKIPQRGLVGAMLNQIPHVRIVQELMDSYPGTREAAGISRKDPEGRYYYDRSTMWAASRALGFPITVSDPKRVQMQHQLLVKGMIRRFQSAGRRADPETREKLQHIINDLANGAFELREWD